MWIFSTDRGTETAAGITPYRQFVVGLPFRESRKAAACLFFLLAWKFMSTAKILQKKPKKTCFLLIMWYCRIVTMWKWIVSGLSGKNQTFRFPSKIVSVCFFAAFGDDFWAIEGCQHPAVSCEFFEVKRRLTDKRIDPHHFCTLSFPVLYDRIFYFKIVRVWTATIYGKIPIRQKRSGERHFLFFGVCFA